ncbi:MAG: response regulator [Planctomycetota bacterium]|nr:response regulator [Planctomycetota bacterium]
MSGETTRRPLEILLVEDSLTDAILTIETLKDGHIQHHLTLVRDAEVAMDFFYRRGKFADAPRPDLVLLDLHLSKLPGLDLLEKIKTDADLKQIPAVVMTGLMCEEDRRKCELLDVAGYLAKPLALDKFVALVRQLERLGHEDLILSSVERPKLPTKGTSQDLVASTSYFSRAVSRNA